MQTIRVINIPPLKAVTSGSITTMEEFEAFDQWWSNIDTKTYITPRDFMWFNKKNNCMEWIFALPEGCMEKGGYEMIDFPGGLYAVGTAQFTEEDSDRVRNDIYNWVKDSNSFLLSSSENDPNERYVMNHVITPKIFKEKMGYHLSDIFVPILVK